MRFLILLLFAIMCFGTAKAQWAQGKGQAYTKLGVWTQSSDTHFNDIGGIEPNGLRTYFIPGFFGRFGLDDKWSLTTYVPLVNTSQELETVEGFTTDYGSSIGDVNLSLEYQLYKSQQSVWGADITFGLPTGKVGSVGSGDGEFNQMVRLLYGGGYKLGEQNFYVKSHVGFNNRTNGFSDEFRYGIETGSTFGKVFGLIRFNSVQSLKNKPIQEYTSSNVFGDRIERTTLGIELNYKLPKNIGLSVGYNKFLSGEFVFNAPSLTYGITLQW